LQAPICHFVPYFRERQYLHCIARVLVRFSASLKPTRGLLLHFFTRTIIIFKYVEVFLSMFKAWFCPYNSAFIFCFHELWGMYILCRFTQHLNFHHAKSAFLTATHVPELVPGYRPWVAVMVAGNYRAVERSTFILLVPRNPRQPCLRRSVCCLYRLCLLSRRDHTRGIQAGWRRRPQCQSASHRAAVRHVAGRRVLRPGRSVLTSKAGWTTRRRHLGSVWLLVLGHVSFTVFHYVRMFRPQCLACNDRFFHHRK